MQTNQLAAGGRVEFSILEVLDEGVIVVGLDGMLLQANAAAAAILGIAADDLLNDPHWWERLAARRAEDGALLDVGARVIATGRGVRDVTVDIERGDGEPVRLSVNYLPLRDGVGEVSGLVLSFSDVTVAERERHTLTELQERLREAHEVAGLSSWEWRPLTDEVLVFHSLSGADAEAGTAISFEELLAVMPPPDRVAARSDLEAIANGERDETVRRHRYAHSDKWLETRTRAIRDPEGRLLCVRGTSQDVTAQEHARIQIATTRDFLQATLDSLPSQVAVLDEDGEVLMTNRAWSLFGTDNGGPPSGYRGNYLDVCDAAPGDEHAVATAAGLRAIMSGSSTEFELEYPCHGPLAQRWFVLRARRYEGPGAAQIVVAHEDVTSRRDAEERVRTQAALLDEVAASVVATDDSGRVTHWNRGAQELYGWTAAEAVGRLAREVIVPTESDGPQIGVELRSAGHWEGEFNAARKDGASREVYIRARVIPGADGQSRGAVAVSVDLSERMANERALLHARNYLRAVADSMGQGLYVLDARGLVTYMNERAERLLGWSQEALLGRVMHDITHTRRLDGSRLPADECPILRAHLDGAAVQVHDDVFIRRDGRELPVSYTAAPFETDDGVQGCVVVFDDISERKAHEASLQRDAETLVWIERIREALAEDRFVLYSQPIIDLRSGATVQHELMLRMRGQDGEILPPGLYLPIAEEYGLIAEIDRWVIERGIELAATGLSVEINLSGHSVGDQSILDLIERCLGSTGADPACVVFEVTETALVENRAAARVFAERLRELGCKLALDDFGTGYGGFTYLKALPIDYLKIDIEFVRDLVTNPGSHHVVEAVVALARGFDLQTVGEGVEDAATLALLRELGVDFAQGYHIARPGPLATQLPRSSPDPRSERPT